MLCVPVSLTDALQNLVPVVRRLRSNRLIAVIITVEAAMFFFHWTSFNHPHGGVMLCENAYKDGNILL